MSGQLTYPVGVWVRPCVTHNPVLLGLLRTYVERRA